MSHKPFPSKSLFGILFALHAVFVTATVATAYAVYAQQRLDADTVNLLGRNRMLSQRIALLSLKAISGEKVGAALKSATELHDSSFYALYRGGTIEGTEGAQRFLPASSAQQAIFAQAEAVWVPFRDRARALARLQDAGGVSADDGKDAEVFISDNADRLLQLNDEIVSGFVADSAQKRIALIYRLLALLFLDVSLAWIVYAYSRRVSSELLEASSGRIRAGKELEASGVELQSKTDKLEKQRAAMLNVLEDLRAEKARMDAILSSVGDGLFVTDDAQKVMYVNNAFERLLGYAKIDVIGKRMPDVVPLFKNGAVEVMEAARPLAQAIIAQRSVQATGADGLAYKKSDGSLMPASLTISPIIIGNKLIGAVEVFRDVTKEREIDKQKSEFVSLASHQLKTPIGAIRWHAEMLLDGDYGALTGDQQSAVREICSLDLRMNELVNSLLNVSRMELGAFIIEPSPADLVKLCDEVLMEIEPRRAQKRQVLTSEFDQGLDKILVDEKMTRIVFQNLISNAVKYTPEKGKIKVSIRKLDGDVQISVANSGDPIPPEDQPMIFSKMFRASNAQAQDPDGNGLGLYLVKQIVENGGGRVWFESEKGKDTVFTVAFPLSGMKSKSGTKRLTPD